MAKGAIHDASVSQQIWYNDYTPSQRGNILLKASTLIKDSYFEELVKREVLDTSRTAAEIRGYDVNSASEYLAYYSHLPSIISHGTVHNIDNSLAYTMREPIGVTVGIGAWNYPLMNAISKSAPALAFGNAMVYKPSEMTPGSALLLAEIYEEAGVPIGVFQVLLGDGKSVEEWNLLDNEFVGKISFTGSVDTGRKIDEFVSKNNPSFPKVTLELGGKSPLIIMEDCKDRLEDAVDAAMSANWYSNGQVCSNGTRVFVHESIKDEFLEQLVKKTSRLKIGHPLDTGTDIGPMISQNHMERVLDYIEVGKHVDQATLLYGGKRLGAEAGGFSFEDGYYLSPAIFINCRDDMRIVQEEIFGMVMSVLTFHDEEEVIERSNASKFGLAAGIYTNSLAQAHRMASSLNAGTVWINSYNLGPVELPFGGNKQSGRGRENGSSEAVYEWTKNKSVYIEMN